MTVSKITRALISVSDKSGLVEFARFLSTSNVAILSTGGSAKTLREANIPVTEVSDHTGFPEIMDGRVKTLHPTIHGGLLARRDDEQHRLAMSVHDIAPIDLLVVNLYPFEETVARGADFETCIENIDIGGPALIRAAAKNHEFVTVATGPEDYEAVRREMSANDGGTTRDLRRRLAAKAYAHTGCYDAAIAGWFARQLGDDLPGRLAAGGRLKQILRYGENPHQKAAFYVGGAARHGIASALQIQGKELSFNNLNDTDAAFELVAEFDSPAIAIIKHANPAGVAEADGLAAAYRQALACDPVSAFGGIIAANRVLDGETATQIADLFAEVVIAPGATDEAKEILMAKKALRVLLTEAVPDPLEAGLTLRSLAGGYLVQTRDTGRVSAKDLKTVTKRRPTPDEQRDMLFGMKVCKHVKSNAIVFACGSATVGVGAGQMSRVDSVRIAAHKASEHAGTKGSVVASDAFFPFPDGLLAAIEAGATAAIQPGGSVRDEEIIAAADKAGIAMVFTGMRHFRH
ncbi:MAG: bifunctional phosphoribosylaminoimidazolecarboxamide formyltransferase/IMP cyclohydrolase [Alphaproteobacteria bacterium]|nr:bifunctional phosphoribosylaminoimidazolecarboxamide formyltransferase/IMP cyclohydrolase [Alphaproteobacteria bacterium]